MAGQGRSRKRWNFPGGGKAHALALRALGFDCVDRTPQARHMRRESIEIIVPIDPWLREHVIQTIVQRGARSREEYVLAWQAKKGYKLNCPDAR